MAAPPHQCVAALVVVRRLWVVAAILQRLAEGKTDVELVGDGSVRTGFDTVHARQLRLGETVGLKVGEAPVGIAKGRTGRRRRR